MKNVLLILAAVLFLVLNPVTTVGQTDGSKVPISPELFQDPVRKVKNAEGKLVAANLQPLFTWYRTGRRGERPMKPWMRLSLKVVEVSPKGILTEGTVGGQVGLLTNYPRTVAPNAVIQVFAIEAGVTSYTDKNGSKFDLHILDYGVVSSSASTTKPSRARIRTRPPPPPSKLQNSLSCCRQTSPQARPSGTFSRVHENLCSQTHSCLHFGPT